MTELFLGIDGGGTKCRARIRDVAGRLIGEGGGGPANIFTDLAGAAASILEAAGEAVATGGLTASSLASLNAGLGVAGLITAKTAPALRAAGLPFKTLSVALDAQAACLGAHGGADGGIVIAGTGSAGFAMVGGEPIGIGGWGFLLGDQGSGAIMGREAARAAVLAIDGLGPSTPLTDYILGELGRDQTVLAEWARTARPSAYAHFAPHVLAFAEQGDEVADGIVGDARRAIEALASRLRELGAPRVSLVGGLAGPLRSLFTDFDSVFSRPEADAMDGAILLAKRGLNMREPFARGVSRA